MSKLKKIPDFKNENEERAFWASADSAEYINWKISKQVAFPNLKPLTSISANRQKA